jgi:hypothetical protein
MPYLDPDPLMLRDAHDYTFTRTNMVLLFIATIMLISIMELMIKKLLIRMKYTDTDHKNLKTEQSTRQWNIVALCVTGFLAGIAIMQAELFTSCDDIDQYNIRPAIVPLVILVAYLSYDMVFHKLPKTMYFHHLLGLIPVTYVLLTYCVTGIYFSFSSLVPELSTTALCMVHLSSGSMRIRWMGIFAVVFFITRPLYMGSIVMNALKCYRYEIGYQISFYLFTLLYGLNMYWFVLIGKKMYRLHGQQYPWLSER